jgi:hypothetical protein
MNKSRRMFCGGFCFLYCKEAILIKSDMDAITGMFYQGSTALSLKGR